MAHKVVTAVVVTFPKGYKIEFSLSPNKELQIVLVDESGRVLDKDELPFDDFRTDIGNIVLGP